MKNDKSILEIALELRMLKHFYIPIEKNMAEPPAQSAIERWSTLKISIGENETKTQTQPHIIGRK